MSGNQISDFEAELITHTNYTKFVLSQTHDLSITYTPNIQSLPIAPARELESRKRIIQLTQEYIDKEKNEIEISPEFSRVCSSWVAIKTYYLIFQMLCITKYLTNGCDETNLTRTSHDGLIKWLHSQIQNGNIVFSNDKFNSLHEYATIESWIFRSGENLRSEIDDEVRFRQLIKKLSLYKLDNLRRQVGNFRSQQAKLRRDEYKANNKVSLFEFFYRYRVQSNYRDLDMLSDGMDIDKIEEYCSSYHQLALNMFDALKDLVNDLYNKRFGEAFLND